jgi:hypothetical protein
MASVRRAKPEADHSRFLEIQAGDQAGKVSDSILIGILKGSDVKLVKNLCTKGGLKHCRLSSPNENRLSEKRDAKDVFLVADCRF